MKQRSQNQPNFLAAMIASCTVAFILTGELLFISPVFADDRLIVGVSTHLRKATGGTKHLVKRLSEANVQSIRDTVHWSRVEYEKGKLKLPAAHAGLNLANSSSLPIWRGSMLILAYGNPKYDGGGFPVSKSALSAFQNYTKFIDEQYGDTVEFLEVWNEWNIGAGSSEKKRFGDAAAYVRLVEASRAALAARRSDTKLIAGAVADKADGWIQEMVRLGVLNFADGISVHPYNFCEKDSNADGVIQYLDNLHEKLKAWTSRKEVPIYVTELGWPTTGRRECGTSESDSAINLAQFYLSAAARPHIKGVWWYTLIDDEYAPKGRQQHFGLLRKDFSPKPSYHALRDVSEVIHTGTVREVVQIGSGIKAVRFAHDEKRQTLALWSRSETTGLILRLKPNTVLKQTVLTKEVGRRESARVRTVNSGRSVFVQVKSMPLLMIGELDVLDITPVRPEAFMNEQVDASESDR